MGGAGPLRGGAAFVWRNARCPARVRVVGGVIFEGRADKPLGAVGVNLTRGVVNFGKMRDEGNF